MAKKKAKEPSGLLTMATVIGLVAYVFPKKKIERPRRPVAISTAIAFMLPFILPFFGGVQLYLRNWNAWPLYYMFFSSLVTFLLYGYDKAQAYNGRWRVSENTLHLHEFLGGWPGALIAQHYFEHKTTKAPFRRTFWCIVAFHQLIWCAIFMTGI
ncbi:DUF1294-domain-containing protein [Glonium stellatum]|uniref:DUF1294-domain-containing protein n=1 Tax=Glonium stellatum TaxID=574774 RepID=A0A8E2F0S1_9PEZI|nr:DUF1294-domain-containing protein [Glonium stellatum]